MTNNASSLQISPRRFRLVLMVASILAFAVLMGVRDEFATKWQRAAVAACAGAFVGLAIVQLRKK